MNFSDMKLKNICLVLRHQTLEKHWVAKNRRTHIIGIALSGSELHDFGYQRFNIDENCIFFLNQKDDFSVWATDMGACYAIHFTTWEEVETDSFCIKLSNISPFLPLFERQIKIAFANEHASTGNFYQICSLFDEIHRRKYTPGDQRMLAAREYMNLHFLEPDCLAKAYGGCALSRRRFDELFRQQFSVTPNRYIVTKKIEYAKKLLNEPNLSVREVSELCGFSDIYYFCKVFKKETSMTPGGFQKSGMK